MYSGGLKIAIAEPYVPPTGVVSIVNGRISPNGQYIATWMQNHDYTANTVVFNQQGELIYSGATTLGGLRDVYWLGNDKLLSFRRGDQAYFLIDPFRREYTYFEAPSYGQENSPTAFLSSIRPPFRLTYDGRYLYDRDKAIYDFVLDEPLSRDNFRWGVPAFNTQQIIGLEYADDPDRETREATVFIYDFDTDIITEVLTFTPGSYKFGYYSRWSPDQTQLAGYFLGEDFDFHHISLLQLDSGEILDTCLGIYFEIKEFEGTRFEDNYYRPDFAWSRDGRYLAVRAVVERQDREESFGVYIYDTHTTDIYEVHRGQADIVGWMSN